MEIARQKTFSFAGVQIVSLTMDGAPCFLAGQIAEALGYKRPKQMADNIGRLHAKEYEEGVDYHLVTGADLRRLRGDVVVESTTTSPVYPSADGYPVVDSTTGYPVSPLAEGHPVVESTTGSSIPPKATSMYLLTESGVYIACLLAKTDRGRDFRRWLSRDVLPALRRDGRYALPQLHLDPVTLDAARVHAAQATETRLSAVKRYEAGQIDVCEYDTLLAAALHLALPPELRHLVPAPRQRPAQPRQQSLPLM